MAKVTDRLDHVRWDEWRGSFDGRPTLWIKRLFAKAGRVVQLHKMVAADDPGCFHSHPAYALRIILRGGYVEEMTDGSHRMWRPGMIGFVKPQLAHRIAGLRNGKVSYSLWVRGKKVAAIKIIGNGWPQSGRRAIAKEVERG